MVVGIIILAIVLTRNNDNRDTTEPGNDAGQNNDGEQYDVTPLPYACGAYCPEEYSLLAHTCDNSSCFAWVALKHKNPSGENLCELAQLILWDDLPGIDNPSDHSLFLTVYKHDGHTEMSYYT